MPPLLLRHHLQHHPPLLFIPSAKVSSFLPSHVWLHYRHLTTSTISSMSAHGATDTTHRGSSQQAELYHQQTKHHLSRYARGPHALDWSNQPNPFLRYHSSPSLPLSHDLYHNQLHYPLIFSNPPPHPQPLSYYSLSLLLYHSFALSAWKSTSSSTWSLRVNPSSGNLHPTEAYIIAPPLPLEGLPHPHPHHSHFSSSAFVAHYAPKEHALELRCLLPASSINKLFPSGGAFLVGLSSVFWREAWKYGERAFRYCNHDVGHAIGAVTVAAAMLGWDVKILDGLGHGELCNIMGIGCGFDAPKREVPSRPTRGQMPWMELEHPDCAMLVFPCGRESAVRLEEGVDYASIAAEIGEFDSLNWIGKPNSLSKEHVCWDFIYKTAEAVEKPLTTEEKFCVDPIQASELLSGSLYTNLTIGEVVRKRRSAVDMDGIHVMSRQIFYQILLHCLPSGNLSPGKKQGKQLAVPFRVFSWDSEVHCVLFVHMVTDLPKGLYFLVRNEDHFDNLKQAVKPVFEWKKPEGCPAGLPLYCLAEGDCRHLAKKLSCHQEIASDGCFSLGMVARFGPALCEKNAWMYPRLFWETGVLGQVLYLEAHAVGISATGIGCYFDDAVHDVLGLKGTEFQSLYHFTVGSPVLDRRIMTLPAYPGPKVDA